MKRINIIGPPGSGKTYLARDLARIYNLPIIHMDNIAHRDAYNPLFDKPAFTRKISVVVKKVKWIMEGVYKSTLSIRVPRADVTIYLDFPRRIYIYRVFKRRWQYRNKKRDEMPGDWKEKINWEFFKFVWRFHSNQTQIIREELDKYPKGKIVTITSPKKLREFLVEL